MAEYIDRNLIEWYGCNFEEPSCIYRECSGCSHAECSHSQIMQIPTADVIERSKITKAIEEIEDLDPITERVGLQVKQEILNILKKNIGE